MNRLMDDVCKATGLSPRQVFAEARFKFCEMRSDEIRQTSNAIFDEYVGTNRLPDYVEAWALDKLRANISNGHIKAKKMSSSRIGPTDHLQPLGASGVSDLFDTDSA